MTNRRKIDKLLCVNITPTCIKGYYNLRLIYLISKRN